MVNRTTDEYSLSQIRLLKAGRPYHIYFESLNARGEDIHLSSDGLLLFNYPEQELDLVIHGEDSPAIYYSDGSLAWVRHGKYHREAAPAITDMATGSIQYWENGEPIFSRAHPIADSVDTNPPILLLRDGPATVFTIAAEKRDESNADLFAVAMAALGTASVLSLFVKRKTKVKPHQRQVANHQVRR